MHVIVIIVRGDCTNRIGLHRFRGEPSVLIINMELLVSREALFWHKHNVKDLHVFGLESTETGKNIIDSEGRFTANRDHKSTFHSTERSSIRREHFGGTTRAVKIVNIWTNVETISINVKTKIINVTLVFEDFRESSNMLAIASRNSPKGTKRSINVFSSKPVSLHFLGVRVCLKA